MAVECYQLDFFRDPEICKVEADIRATNESLSRVRKKLFAEHGKHKKLIDDIVMRLEIIERNICRGSNA